MLNLSFILTQQPFIGCNYRIYGDYYYCDLSIFNPDGLNNFTSIAGNHLEGKSNMDVQKLKPLETFNSVSTNFPSIICDTFINVSDMEFLWRFGIQRIDADSFRNCRFLKNLNLVYNNITQIDEDAFVENVRLEQLNLDFNQLPTLPERVFRNQQFLETLTFSQNEIVKLPVGIFRGLYNLRMLNLLSNNLTVISSEWFEDLYIVNRLYLNNNFITELPVGAFKNMKSLMRLYLENNALSVIASNSFSQHPILEFIHLMNNRINAIDERFVDNTAVRSIRMENNICANLIINDDTPGREILRSQLSTCFENFQDTSCPNDRIAERVCTLEDTNVVFNENFDQLRIENKELRIIIEDLERRIADLEGSPRK